MEHNIFVRVARPEDVFELFNLVELYEGDVQIDKTKAKNNLRDMLYNGGVFLVRKDEIVIAGIAAYYFDGLFNDDKMFCVMFFFVKKEFRNLTRLIVIELENALKTTKVSKILYGFLVGQNQAKQLRFMRMLGYKESETHVYKNI